MALSVQQKNTCIEGNKHEFADRYEQLLFPDQKILLEADKRRQDIIQELTQTTSIGALGSKLDMADLSPGCQLCVEGAWSCLFINGRCNGSCFYCPTSQNEVGQPTTNTVSFPNTKDYIAYLRVFGFQGASISGGEPLLTLDTSLRFIRAIKKQFGNAMYLWLYTNGLLATREVMQRLADAGLDEIRFDIGATGYSLSHLELAIGIIPTVTVEIPAVPEEGERMKRLLPRLYDCGIQHLNLHQLRLTPYNFAKMVARNYRYLHGNKVTVLDSELTALELLLERKRKNILLPINYCSFPYKNRFQARAARRRNAPFILKSYESITENGFIRLLMLKGKHEVLEHQLTTLEKKGYAATLWHRSSQEKLYLHPSLLPFIDLQQLNVQVSYCAAYQRQSAGYRNPFTKISLTKTRSITIERESFPHAFPLSSEQTFILSALINQTNDQQPILKRTSLDLPEQLIDFEYTPAGLAEYY